MCTSLLDDQESKSRGGVERSVILLPSSFVPSLTLILLSRGASTKAALSVSLLFLFCLFYTFPPPATHFPSHLLSLPSTPPISFLCLFIYLPACYPLLPSSPLPLPPSISFSNRWVPRTNYRRLSQGAAGAGSFAGGGSARRLSNNIFYRLIKNSP